MPYKDPELQREYMRQWRAANPAYHTKYNRRYYNKALWAAKYAPKRKEWQRRNRMKITPFGVAVQEYDTHLSRWVEEHGRLDIAEGFLQQFQQYIPEGGVVVDAGACIGDHTLTYSKLVGPAGRVVAFEPNPRAFECLSYNMASRANVECMMIALGATQQQYGAMANNPNLGASQVVPLDSSIPAPYTDPITIRPLDEVARDWQRFDFMKVDVEGMEEDLLLGGAVTIARLRPVMLIEVNDATLRAHKTSRERLLALILALGYSYMPCEPHLTMDLQQVDILCVPLKIT